MTAHRERYPDQYEHELVNERVRITGPSSGGDRIEGTVERVVVTRFGPLVILAEHGPEQGWPVRDATVVEEDG